MTHSTTGAIFAALKKAKAENSDAHLSLHGQLSEFEIDIRNDVQCVHAAADRIHHFLLNEYTTGKKADTQAKLCLIGLAVAFAFAGGAATFDIVQHRRDFREARAEITAIKEPVRGCVQSSVSAPEIVP